MSSRKSLVDQAIRFECPERIPIVFWNRDQTEGDVLLYHLSRGVPGDGTCLGQCVGLVDERVGLSSGVDGRWHDGPPDAGGLARVAGSGRSARAAVARRGTHGSRGGVPRPCEDRYRLASLDLSGFTVYTFLRGFENAMQDFLIAPEQFGPLMDLIMDFECQLMTMAARHGFHGIHFADDWATQSGMIISPAMWRSLFKPRYQRQFDHAHRLGTGRLVPLLRQLDGYRRGLS